MLQFQTHPHLYSLKDKPVGSPLKSQRECRELWCAKQGRKVLTCRITKWWSIWGWPGFCLNSRKRNMEKSLAALCVSRRQKASKNKQRSPTTWSTSNSKDLLAVSNPKANVRGKNVTANKKEMCCGKEKRSVARFWSQARYLNGGFSTEEKHRLH